MGKIFGLYIVDTNIGGIHFLENLIMDNLDNIKLLGHAVKGNDFLNKLNNNNLAEKIQILMISPKLIDINCFDLIVKAKKFNPNITVCLLADDNLRRFYQNEILMYNISYILDYNQEEEDLIKSIEKILEEIEIEEQKRFINVYIQENKNIIDNEEGNTEIENIMGKDNISNVVNNKKDIEFPSLFNKTDLNKIDISSLESLENIFENFDIKLDIEKEQKNEKESIVKEKNDKIIEFSPMLNKTEEENKKQVPNEVVENINKQIEVEDTQNTKETVQSKKDENEDFIVSDDLLNEFLSNDNNKNKENKNFNNNTLRQKNETRNFTERNNKENYNKNNKNNNKFNNNKNNNRNNFNRQQENKANINNDKKKFDSSQNNQGKINKIVIDFEENVGKDELNVLKEQTSQNNIKQQNNITKQENMEIKAQQNNNKINNDVSDIDINALLNSVLQINREGDLKEEPKLQDNRQDSQNGIRVLNNEEAKKEEKNKFDIDDIISNDFNLDDDLLIIDYKKNKRNDNLNNISTKKVVFEEQNIDYGGFAPSYENFANDIEINTKDTNLDDLIKIDEERSINDLFPDLNKIGQPIQKHYGTTEKNFDDVKRFVKQSIVFYSTKGGVGKTTTLVNTAIMLAKYTNKRVCVIDFDLSNPNVHIHLGISDFINDLSDIVKKGDKLDSTILSKIKYTYRFDTEEGEKSFDVFIGYSKENYVIDKIDEIFVTRLINILQNMYDIVLIDTNPHYTDKAISTILKRATKIIFIVEQEFSALDGASKFIQMVHNFKIPIDKIYLVINKYMTDSKGLTENKIQNALGLPVKATVPLDIIEMRNAVNEYTPVVLSKEKDRFEEVYINVAKIVLPDMQINKKESKSIFSFFKKKSTTHRL